MEESKNVEEYLDKKDIRTATVVNICRDTKQAGAMTNAGLENIIELFNLKYINLKEFKFLYGKSDDVVNSYMQKKFDDAYAGIDLHELA